MTLIILISYVIAIIFGFTIYHDTNSLLYAFLAGGAIIGIVMIFSLFKTLHTPFSIFFGALVSYVISPLILELIISTKYKYVDVEIETLNTFLIYGVYIFFFLTFATWSKRALWINYKDIGGDVPKLDKVSDEALQQYYDVLKNAGGYYAAQDNPSKKTKKVKEKPISPVIHKDEAPTSVGKGGYFDL